MKYKYKNTSKILFLAVLFILFSCENLDESSCPDPQSGKFIKTRAMGKITAEYINSLRSSYGLPDDFVAQYDINVYSVEYETADPDGNSSIASGAVYIPIVKPGKILSLISGQHGLTIRKADVASIIPSYGYLGLFGAGIGYAVIQPDYLGLGVSTFPYHPMAQKSNGKVLLDMVEGMGSFACENDINLNENLFLVGYSDGGYSSLAMQEELNNNPRSFDIDASIIIAGFFNPARPDSFIFPDRIEGHSSWLVYMPYTYNRRYKLNIIDKIIKAPYLEKLDNLYSGDLDSYSIDNQLTSVTKNLFTSDFLNHYDSLSIYDSYKNTLNDNSLLNTSISGSMLLIHSKEDEVVPYSQSVKLYNNISKNGGSVEIVLLENGKHSPQDYAPSIVDALGWLDQFSLPE